MAVDPRILQQYVDDYNKRFGIYQGEVKRINTQNQAYNNAVNSYNTSLDAYNTNAAPQIKSLENQYKGEMDHLDADYRATGDNHAKLKEYEDWHFGRANQYNKQMSALERTMPLAPSALNGLFDEKRYLAKNPDVADSVARGAYASGLQHYMSNGRNENRIATLGGEGMEQKLREAAAWQIKQEQAFNDYINALEYSRVRHAAYSHAQFDQGTINAIQKAAADKKAAYEAVINARPGMPEQAAPKQVAAPGFTQEQLNMLTGNVGLGKQMLQQEGGLIGGELASAANERNSDSMIAGILSKARGRG